MSQDNHFLWAAVLTLLGAWVLIPGINRPLLWLFDKHLVKAVIWSVEKVMIWFFWLLNWMWISHWVLARHLFTPRSVFMPTTDDQRQQTKQK